MESVKRLRKYANGPCVYKNQKRVLLEIAEAFEVEHAEAYAKAYDDGYDEGFASADDWLGQHEEAMAEHGWVKLPKDADGMTIRVGDVMEWPDGKTFDVVGIGDGVLFYIENADGPADWTGASTKRHHHEPTVEDVLREMADRIYADEDEPRSRDAIVAEYAQRLRLAGDE